MPEGLLLSLRLAAPGLRNVRVACDFRDFIESPILEFGVPAAPFSLAHAYLRAQDDKLSPLLCKTHLGPHVKSGRRRDGLPGMAAFEAAHGPARKLLIGGDGTPLDAFLASSEITDI